MKKYTFTKENLVAVLKVLAWSAASAVVASLIAVWQDTEVPANLTFLVPLVNTALYALKEFVSARR